MFINVKLVPILKPFPERVKERISSASGVLLFFFLIGGFCREEESIYTNCSLETKKL